MINGTKKEGCYYCGNTHYLAPYAQSSKFVICSRACWEGWKILAEKKKQHQQDEMKMH